MEQSTPHRRQRSRLAAVWRGAKRVFLSFLWNNVLCPSRRIASEDPDDSLPLLPDFGRDDGDSIQDERMGESARTVSHYRAHFLDDPARRDEFAESSWARSPPRSTLRRSFGLLGSCCTTDNDKLVSYIHHGHRFHPPTMTWCRWRLITTTAVVDNRNTGRVRNDMMEESLDVSASRALRNSTFQDPKARDSPSKQSSAKTLPTSGESEESIRTAGHRVAVRKRPLFRPVGRVSAAHESFPVPYVAPNYILLARSVFRRFPPSVPKIVIYTTVDAHYIAH